MHGVKLVVEQEMPFGVAFFLNLLRAMRYSCSLAKPYLFFSDEFSREYFAPPDFDKKIEVVNT